MTTYKEEDKYILNMNWHTNILSRALEIDLDSRALEIENLNKK